MAEDIAEYGSYKKGLKWIQKIPKEIVQNIIKETISRQQ